MRTYCNLEINDIEVSMRSYLHIGIFQLSNWLVLCPYSLNLFVAAFVVSPTGTANETNTLMDCEELKFSDQL